MSSVWACRGGGKQKEEEGRWSKTVIVVDRGGFTSGSL